ncbi:MAG TPA: metallopeptidase TldD-related protein [Gemmatimonadota bacterium]|nr:metallopeptidase TldD-related protein [Gemmatimonadota bacterium]
MIMGRRPGRMAIMTEQEARRIVDAVMESATADATIVDLVSREGGNTRFAMNGVTTSGEVSNVGVIVTSTFGARTGRAETNGVDDEAIAAVVRRAEEAARLAPEDPEYVPPLDRAEYADPRAFFESTAAYGPTDRASAVAAAIGEAVERDTTIAGFLEGYRVAGATANSKGVFGYFPMTWLEYTNTVRTPDGKGSGWAGVRLHDAAGLDAAARARVAVEKAMASREVEPLEPGDYPVVLEPAAVAVMAGALVGQMDARRAMEGRSYLSAPQGETRRGQQLVAANVTIETDPLHAVVPGRAWAGEQLPARPTTWYREGIVETLRFDRYWAQKSGVEPVPEPTNLVMTGESRSLEELIRDTERGVLVTRLWYIRMLNPTDLTLTGLTRDGTFWIEDGRIAHAVNNFRWNESPVRFFERAEAMSRAERVADEDWAVSPSYVPAVRSSAFRFSSISQAV